MVYFHHLTLKFDPKVLGSIWSISETKTMVVEDEKKIYILDYLYLIILYMLISYISFMGIIKRLLYKDVSLAIYIGLGISLSIVLNSTKMKLKKQNTSSSGVGFLSIALSIVLYIFLFKYYNYDFLHEKDSWRFSIIFLSFILFEAMYYFLSVEQLKELDIGFFDKKSTKSTKNYTDKEENKTLKIDEKEKP